MINTKNLKTLLKAEENSPLEVITILRDDKNKSGLAHHLNIHYCCWGTGWGKREKGDPDENLILDSIGIVEAILIKVKYGTLDKFKKGFSREMHLINQDYIRIERFEYITSKIFDKVETLLKSINIEDYLKKNFNKVEKLLPVNLNEQRLQTLDRFGVLLELEAKKITSKKANSLLKRLEDLEEEAKEKSDNLCGFKDSSGRKNHPCSHPGGNTNCGSCRVAAEWEELYG